MRAGFLAVRCGVAAFVAIYCVALAKADAGQSALPVAVGSFAQQVQLTFTQAQGLPSNDVQRLARDASGTLFALTDKGVARYADGAWSGVNMTPEAAGFAPLPTLPSLGPAKVRGLVRRDGETAVAAAEGLILGNDGSWRMGMPQQGAVRWAPVDVRAVAYDAEGRLWFACPQGVGCREQEGAWRLYTGAEGLPFNDFTCMATGPSGVWFGTTNGAIRFADGVWEFRQGRRWLLDNHVRDIAIDAKGDAWFATAAGVSCIASRPMRLSEKAAFFSDEIEKHHRRTRFGYVNPATLATPGDKSVSTPKASDNDGHFTGLYLATTSLGYAATKNATLRTNAERAFAALAFLSEVTEGGTHPAPKGFIARAIEPVSGPDPNLENTAEKDRIRRDTRDALWKVIEPRWPVDASGEWYWKCDSSSDELDGHYFGFGVYFDRVCETEEQKEPVRTVVRRITDHLIEHGFTMIDHDGKPTRWGHFSPDDMNRNPAWWFERGLNSISILTYLAVAHHVTGDQKYRDAYLHLALDEGYAMNAMGQFKFQASPGAYGQADDNMCIMNLYHLLRYETDPKLLDMYRSAAYYYWRVEKFERNPFFNFVYAACCLGKSKTDQWGTMDLSPAGPWVEVSIDTLKRYPLDLIDWPMSNAHRIDLLPLPEYARDPGGGNQGKGYRVDGYVFPIDESHAIYWGDDPWDLSHEADGTLLREGVSFLLAYYLGVVHGYIAD